MKLTVEIGVGPDGDWPTLCDLWNSVSDPVAALWRFPDDVCPALCVEVLAGLTSVGFRHGEGDCGVGVVVDLVDQALPDLGPVNVKGHDVGSKLLQDVEGAHGRRRTEDDESLPGEVAPLRVLDDGGNGIRAVLLDRPPLCPHVGLVDERLVVVVVVVVVLSGFRGRCLVQASILMAGRTL